MIVSGVHSSKDTPPQIPLITGITKRKRKMSEDEDGVNTAAAAIVKAVGNITNTQIVNSQNTEAQSPRTGQFGPIGVHQGKRQI